MDETPNIFYKIVHENLISLAPRSLIEIGGENFGTEGRRPLVLFADQQEALEKSLWFYAHNILPLIGEPNNFPATLFAARRYEIDAMISEPEIAKAFFSHLTREYDTSRIIYITLIGRRFEISDLQFFYLPGRKLRAVLALPAVGAFAEACREALAQEELWFHPDANSRIDISRGVLSADNYNTDIAIGRITRDCKCGNPLGFEVL